MNEPKPPDDRYPCDPEPISEASPRVRPGLRGASWKVLLWLLLIALVPTVVLIATSWSLADDAGAVRQEVSKAYSELQQGADTLAGRVDALRQEIDDSRRQQARIAHQKLAEKSLKELNRKLAALVADKSADDISADKRVKAGLQAGQGPFSDAVIFDPGNKKALVLKSDTQPGPLEKVLPELAQKVSSGKKSPDFSEPGWYWTSLGRSNLVLAVEVTPLPKDSLPPRQLTPSPVASTAGLKKLEAFGQALNRRSWILLVALPLITLALVAAAFWWLNSGLLSPLRNLTVRARELIEDPAGVDPQALARSGLLDDLGGSLSRYLERMRRLEQLETDFEQTKAQLEKIREVLKEASHGYLGRRIEVGPGECERLALECNLLLDSAAERLEGFQQVGGHMQASAGRLTDLARKLSSSVLTEESDPPLPDPGSLGDVLGVKLESLCLAANQMAEGVLKDAPEGWVNQDNETHMNSLGNASTGLRVLVQRANEVKGYSGQMTSVRREAEVLSTNLAIAAEAHSWSQVEKLIDQIHSLANGIADLSDSLVRDLEQLVRAGIGAAETVEEANQRYVSCIDRLLSWENLLESFHRHRTELLSHISLVRPAAGSLGGDVRRLGQAYQKYRRILKDKQETLSGVAESSQALARTVDEMLKLIHRVETPKLAPAAVTRNLADRQHALENAIRDLTQLASEEGIQSLTPDASEILERIRSVAEEAKKRITNDTGAGA